MLYTVVTGLKPVTTTWERQINLMEQGFHMGQRQRIKRDDLYERD